MYFQLYTAKGGEWRWRLEAGNHETIASSSQGYSAKQPALQASRWSRAARRRRSRN